MKRGELVKLVAIFPDGDEGSAETLWAEIRRPPQIPAEERAGLGWSRVRRRRRGIVGDDGRPHFTRIVQRSGLLTVRAAEPDAPPSALQTLVHALKSRAVATEHYSASYRAFAMTKPEFNGFSAEIEAGLSIAADALLNQFWSNFPPRIDARNSFHGGDRTI